jgi:hypothetical protein
MSDTPRAVDLSIVVALSGRGTLPSFVTALKPQLGGTAAEVLVVGPVSTADRDTLAGLAISGANWTLIERQPGELVPTLWALGVGRAQGRFVAITMSSCVPDAIWVKAILRACREGVAAVGGAIEMPDGCSLVDRAIYFVRYTSYMLPFVAGPVAEIPGDNGTYRRDALREQMDWITAHGFWETEINAVLRRQQRGLWMDPAIVVFHKGSFGAAAFSRQRLQHGRIFGAMRRDGLSPVARAARVAMTPVVPVLMALRILRSLLRKRRLVGSFIAPLPLTMWFLSCWALGESLGILMGAPGRERSGASGPPRSIAGLGTPDKS